MVWLVAVAAVLLALFVLSYQINRASLLPGFLFWGLFLYSGILYALMVIWLDVRWLFWTLSLVAVALVLLVAFGLFLLIALLLWNARVVAKRERRSLGNRLTLLLALGLILLLVLSVVLRLITPPAWVSVVWSGLVLVLLAIMLHMVVFVTSVFLCNLSRPKKRQDYVVVLGSGLVRGKVTPLLAARLDRAAGFYHKQRKKRRPPMLVMSGGQGGDEPRSEAAAMKEYALKKGVAEEHILLEDRSSNTGENVAYSKALIGKREGQRKYRCILATSNYHLLRAGMLARAAGLTTVGLGARTAAYYLPNALLREYVAYLSMHKKRIALVAVMVFLAGCAVYGIFFPAVFQPGGA